MTAVRWETTDIVAGGPGWWSGNSVIDAGVRDGTHLIRKTPREHLGLIVTDPGAQLRLKVALDASGLGPAVIELDDVPEGAAGADHAIVMEDLRPSHRVATLGRLAAPGLVDRVIDAHRAVADLQLDLPTLNIFDELRRLQAVVAAEGSSAPADSAAIEAAVASLEATLPADQLVASLGDATAGNHLIADDGESISLVGGTLACVLDRRHLAGILLAEFGWFCGDPHDIVERALGSTDADDFRSAVRYSLLEDLRWGYISRIATARNADDSFVSSLYGMWRVRRAMFTMSQPGFDDWRRAA
ncbi:hypothetical protein [Subtercola endophyticus]|uniref:hypothetical protein n=1 Tax=Subtercola endophyticus TaxID=2895559 RepID=UPI001E28C420|nr:hypothetical protein [Subtercola endophyticus]UFS58614.1 hypothetical protein LQ955_16690 [Subtercola endophyticus]